MTALTQFRGSRELLANLTMREVRGKYKRTVLGQLWSLINPLATMPIYTLVFGLVLQGEIPPGKPSGLDVFALWLICALLPWNFLNTAVSGGMGSLVGNANLIKKVYFRRDTLVARDRAVVRRHLPGRAGVLSWRCCLRRRCRCRGSRSSWCSWRCSRCSPSGSDLMLSMANVYFRDTQHFVGIVDAVLVLRDADRLPDHVDRTATARQGLAAVRTPAPAASSLPAQSDGALRRSLPQPDVRQPVAGAGRLAVLRRCRGHRLALGSWVFTKYEGQIAEEL